MKNDSIDSINMSAFQRVVVVGCSCSGKTTFARRLASLFGVPHTEMDELFWGENWTPKPAAEFHRLVTEAAEGDAWALDGNYRAVRDVLWSRATLIVWLNYSFPTVFGRALRRTFGRLLSGQALWHGNVESVRRTFSRDSILLWVATTYRRKRQEFQDLRASNTSPQVNWLELKHPAEAEQLLHKLKSQQANIFQGVI